MQTQSSQCKVRFISLWILWLGLLNYAEKQDWICGNWEKGERGGRQEVVERVDEKVDFLAGG